jgi:hypothetical protein
LSQVGPKVDKLNMTLAYLNYQPNIFSQLVRLNKFSDEQFIQPRICAEASQILLIAEQNLKFCSHPQRKTLRNGGKND